MNENLVLTRFRILIVLFFLLGASHITIATLSYIERVNIDIPDEGLATIAKVVPPGTFKMYVSADTVPQSAEELSHFALDVASGDNAVSAATVAQQLGMSGSCQATSCQEVYEWNTPSLALDLNSR